MYAPSNGMAPLRVGRLYRHHSYECFPTSGGQVHDDVLPLDLLQQKLLLPETRFTMSSMSVVVVAVNVTLDIEAVSPPSATTHLYYRSMLFFSSSVR